MRSVRQLAPTLLLVLAVGCEAVVDAASAGPDEAPSPPAVGTPTATPPAPALVAVEGERVPGAYWVDSSGLLTHAAEEVGPPDTVLPAVHAIGDWLDAHLDDLQRGGPGKLAEVAPPDLLATATPAELTAVTTALASPAAPVAGAVYRLDAAYHHTTEWVTATVEVTTATGAGATATLVFVPTGTGPQLVIFGPAEAAA